MSQVNLLSVDVGQNLDMQGSKGEASIKNQAKASAFSDAMDQHYPIKKVVESDVNTKPDGNLVSKAAVQHPQVLKNDSSLKSAKAIKADDAHTLPVPLPVDDESLTKKLTASDNAHTLPVPFPIDIESLIPQVKAEKTVNDDAHILPVPLPIDDESLITKPAVGDGYTLPLPISPNGELLISITKSKSNEHILPVPVSPLQAENKAIEKAGGTLNGAPKALSIQQSLSLDFQTKTQAVNSVVNNVENDDAVNLLKMLNGAQQLLTKPTAEKTSIEQKGKNTAVVTEQLLASNKNSTQLEQSKNLTAELSVLAKTVKGEQLQVSPNASGAQQAQLGAGSKNTAENVAEKSLAVNVADSSVASVAKQMTSKEANTASLASEKVIVDEVELIAKQARIHTLAQEIDTALDKNKNTQQVSVNRELHNSTTDKASEFDLAKHRIPAPELGAELSAVHKGVADENNQAKVPAAELKQVSVADFKRVSDNEPTQARTINQSTAALITTSTADPKTNINQQTVVNEDVGKLASTPVDEQKLSKNDSEKQAPQFDKIASVINQTLDAQAARPMASFAEIAAQQEQSFESTINQLTTNTVQSQKSITAMNTETIAIYRKDFADAVKDKVMVMINQKIQQVDIQLDPPEMGNIHVRVNLQNEQAAVQFVVQNQQAKEALEQNMGKLRDMLAESGVDVGEANIEQRQAKEQNSNSFDRHPNNSQGAESAEDNISENDNLMHNVVKASSTGVDYYA